MSVSQQPRTNRLPCLAESELVRTSIIGILAFLTVVDLFAAQALLPSLAHRYDVSPAAMGLAVNACTLGMAAAGLIVALIGEGIDRRLGILVSLTLLAIPTALLAHAPNLFAFAALRITQGLFMAAAFSLTLAHLGERFTATAAAGAFAAYITGNVASNLVGRLIAAGVADHAGLGAAFYVFAALNLSGAALVYVTVEGTQKKSHIDSTMMTRHSGYETILAHARNPVLRATFAIGFCILFAFIGTFTFVNFVLVSPPFAVSMMQLGLIYFVFLPSIVTTLLAGAVSSRLGTRNALLLAFAVAVAGLPLLLSRSLLAVIAGLVLVAAGTFFAQALATGYVSRAAASDRAAASGMYLACYFIGGLVGTSILGQIFDRLGWNATVAGVGVSLVVAAFLSVRLETMASRNEAGKKASNNSLEL